MIVRMSESGGSFDSFEEMADSEGGLGVDPRDVINAYYRAANAGDWQTWWRRKLTAQPERQPGKGYVADRDRQQAGRLARAH